MITMTWKEFKKAVEEKGVTDDMILDYIDVSMIYDELMVHIEKDNSFSVH